MYIFNPEHDLCLANGDIHFVPPESAIAFGRDCASITEFFRGLDKDADCDFPKMKKIIPWGWNHTLRDSLLKQGIDKELIATDRKIEQITELSHRKRALEGLEFLCRETNLGILPHSYRIAAESVEQVEEFISRHRFVVLKAPLSGSGKGIRFVTDALSHSDKGWCKNLIEKQQCVVVEKRYTPVLEFAMLFKCSKSGVEFFGYSLFTAQNGAYRGNILASNEFIKDQISEFIDLDCLDIVQNELQKFLWQTTKGEYEGFIGVDQFICTNYPQHSDDSKPEMKMEIFYNPLVEINFRMTMGIVARNIFDNFATKLNLSDGSHIFEICRSKQNGKTSYSYHFRPLQLSRIR